MEQIIYTDSAIIDKICKVLHTRKYVSVAESFRANPHGTFLFDPTDDPDVNDIFLQKTEEFPLYVKKAVAWFCCGKRDDPLYKTILNSLKVRLQPSEIMRLNQWSARHEGIPVSVKCQIIGSLDEETYTKKAECVCMKCEHRIKIHDNIMPEVCANPKCPSRFHRIDPDSVESGDIKTIIIQEPMDEVRHGKPAIKTCVVKDDLVFDSYPGQRKILNGVLRSIPLRNSNRNKIVINAISMTDIDDDSLIFPDELEKKMFHTMAKKPDFIKKITESFAPEIKFRDTEKLAVILSRIGSQKSGNTMRGNIHSLLIGPPATAKSKILEFIPHVTQRSGFAVGGMATGAGITVAMTTLPDKTKFPRGGIVVQCSGSCVALDELNQFPADDIGKTYTAMESGKIHYNKGGFDQVFLADTTIIAGANPKNGYYMESLGMVKNINLPAPMISRFDIIVNVLPEKSETQSQQISDHTFLIREMGVEKYIQKNGLLKPDELLRFFNYASAVSVSILPEAKKTLDDYVKTMMSLQNQGEQEDGSKQFDRRFIESVMRVAEAFTRLHLQHTMTERFATMAIDYIKSTLETFGLKTDKGMMQIPLEKQDEKDKNIAFDRTWMQMCKDAGTEMLPEADFEKFLCDQYPKLFSTAEKAVDFFRKRHEKGDLIYERGRYRMVK